MKKSFVTPIIERVARQLKLRVRVEPKYGYAGQLLRRDGQARYFRGSRFDLNPLGASEIAQDKAYAAFFLDGWGYPVPRGAEFFTPRWCETIRSRRGKRAAARYAQTLGWPVIVKPNAQSQGQGVCLVYNRREFLEAVRSFENRENVFLVQKWLAGNDYRIVVLDREVISAYQRLPLSVSGDGRTTIRSLLLAKQRKFRQVGRDTVIKIDDFRITNMLRHSGLARRSVPARGQLVRLLPNANLSTGGEALDVTATLHPAWRKLAVDLVRKMGLRFCGLDVIVEGTLAEVPKRYAVLEINAAPGLDHYAVIGPVQRRLVERLYRKVVRAMIS